MRILLVSMPSIHVSRWIENLENSGHELYWFDILGRGHLPIDCGVKQLVDWKKRKMPYIKGEFFLSKKLPKIYEFINPLLEITPQQKFEMLLNEIKPDLVHSFEMQSCSYPLVKTLEKYPKIKWLYSCWGSDLYYYSNLPSHLPKIKGVLKRLDFLHTDCNRDYKLAKKFGFKGEYLGVIPGGAGYKLEEYLKYYRSLSDRNIILIKGYQHEFGRGLNVIKALEEMQGELLDYEVVVFGAHINLINYINNKGFPFKYFNRHGLVHDDLMKLMGKSLIYIGNSISDGMPNTLLEAIIMGAFPIQSNPGGVTEEIIEDGINGFLIEYPNDIMYIRGLIRSALIKKGSFEKVQKINNQLAIEKLEYECCKSKILELYKTIGL